MTACVIIVNYNSAPLALRAAMSVIGDDPDAKIVIVDNASTDDSGAVLRSAARGAVNPAAGANPPPGVSLANAASVQIGDSATNCKQDADIIIIEAGRNRGFAAGCNIGIAYAKRCFNPDMVLFLNPDAMMAMGSINAIRACLSDKAIGLCGATVLRSSAPFAAQAFGGARLNPATLLGRNIGEGQTIDQAPAASEVEAQLDYPLGAAIACRRDYIDAVGVFDERFFLYYEEADWARRGRGRFRIGWAPDAIVYHDHGASAGSKLAGGGRSPLADYHMARSRLLYALKWRPWLAPVVVGLAFIQAGRRILRGRIAQALAVLIGGAPGAPRQHHPFTY